MALRGHVSSMSLEEVLSFLGANGLEGELAVRSGEDASLRLYFQEGRVFFPFSARKGTYSLGKLLRHTGVLSREGLESYLSEARRKRKAELLQAEASADQLADARRRQTSEEIHDLFLWGDAHFEFLPGAIPPRVAADQAAGRGLLTDVQSLLMEVARRQDERRRIRASIPSSRVILRTRPGAEDAVVAGLTGARIDVAGAPFDGRLRVDDLLARWGVPHHDALGAVSLLVEAKHVEVLPLDEARAGCAAALAAGDLEQAARFLGHETTLDPGPADRFAPGPELALVRAPAWRGAAAVTAGFGLPGPRVFGLLRELLRGGAPFHATVRAGGRELLVAALPGEVSVHGADLDLPRVHVGLGHLKTKAIEAAAAPGGPGALALLDTLSLAQREEGRRAAVAEALAEVALWPRADLELRSRHTPCPSTGTCTAALLPVGREELLQALAVWHDVFQRVPGEDALLVAHQRAEGGEDPAARFFQRFELRRSVGELRLQARAGRLEFVKFAARGVRKGYLRRPEPDELEEAFAAARELGDDLHAARLARAAAALGQGDALLRRLGPLATDANALAGGVGAGVEGDLEGVGLAAVLQTLRENRRTGTLTVTAARREERLCFLRGDVYFLRVEDPEAAAFAEFFLGEGADEQVSELLEHKRALGLVDEGQLDQAEVRELKAAFLDTLFWEGARFAFHQNVLPDEFFAPGEHVSRVALQTDRFLLDAIRALTEWDAIRRVVPTGRAVFRFPDLARKMDAIRDLGAAEVLTLVDGRKSFDDVVRISGERRLAVGRLVKRLVEEGGLEHVGDAEALADGAPASTLGEA